MNTHYCLRLIILLALCIPSWRGQSVPKGGQRTASVKCVSVEQIANYLETLWAKDKNSYPERTLIGQIKSRGICSAPTEGELGRIRAAHGSSELLLAIEEAMPRVETRTSGDGSRGVPPLPQTKNGNLIVSCEPVDCTVLANNKEVGKTRNGLVTIVLPEGQTAISAVAEDYEAEDKLQTKQISETDIVKADFHFKPSRKALERAGTDLFKRMISSIAGEDPFQNLKGLRGRGTLTTYDRDGTPAVWRLSALLKWPRKARYAISRNTQVFECVRSDQGVEWSKKTKGNELGDLELFLGLFQQYHISDTVKRLESPGFKIMSDRLPKNDGNGTVLSVSSGSDTYMITLDQHVRPIEINVVSTGFDNGRRILYSNYEKAPNTSWVYPRRIQILLPDAPKHGFEIHFDDVVLDPPDLTDADFSLKKNWKF